MTNETDIQTPALLARRVVMVIYPDAHILDVVGSVEVLTGSKLFLPEAFEPYDVTVVAERAGSIATTSGITVEAGQSFTAAAADTRPIDTLIVAGGHGTSKAQFSANLLSQKASDPKIAETMEYIVGNVAEDLTVTALAARVFISERNFASKFKDETGATPAHYVDMARLQTARVQLLSSLPTSFGQGRCMFYH